MSDSNLLSDPGWLGLDEIVERFEDAWQASMEPCVDDFLPSANHPKFDKIAIELLCIDFERRAKLERKKSIEAYRKDFPELLERNSILAGLAFEEYRLRYSDDPQINPAIFARKYGIRTEHWPQPHDTQGDTQAIAHSALRKGVADEMHRIASVSEMPEVGDSFLDFELVAELGACQFGRVYRAKQRGMSNRDVVIKISSNVWLECERLARLQHTHIVPVYSVHGYKELQAVCMPYLGKQTLDSILNQYFEQPETSGQSLFEIWAKSGAHGSQTDRSRLRKYECLQKLTHEQLSTWIVFKIALGLSHAHDRGILHRDLKPANILMTDDFRPMILDFNLSEDAVAGGRPSLLIGGTLPYMAPEHLKALISDGQVDERSDIYSVGVILFQLLTGRFPFDLPPNSAMGGLHYLLDERTKMVPAVRTLDPRLSTDIESIVMRCLAADPMDRYSSARELCEDLERHIRFLPPAHAPIRSRQEQMSKWVKRHPRITSSSAVAVIAATILAILAVFLFARSREVSRLSARHSFAKFKKLEKSASAPLSIPLADDSVVKSGVQLANSALAVFTANHQDWDKNRVYRWLPANEQQEVRRLVRRLHYLLADAHFRQSLRRTSRERERLLHLALDHNQLAISKYEQAPAPALYLQQDEIHRALGMASDSIRRDILDFPDTTYTDQSSRLLAAMHSMRRKEFVDAEILLSRLNRDYPQDFLVWLALGNCKFGLDRQLEADSCFSSALALWPDSPYAYFLRGSCRREMKHLAEAELDFTRAIELSADNLEARLARAATRMERQQYRQAVQDLTHVLQAGRQDALVYLLRADAHKHLGQEEAAKRDLEIGKKMTPVCIDGWIQRGLAFRNSDSDAALGDFNTALEMEPNSGQALQNKAAILSQLNRNREAIDVISKLLELAPNNTTYLLGRGLLRARCGDRTKALADRSCALRIANSATNYYQSARILANTSREYPQDVAEAALHLRKALRSEPRLSLHLTRDSDLHRIAEQPSIQTVLAAARELAEDAHGFP